MASRPDERVLNAAGAAGPPRGQPSGGVILVSDRFEEGRSSGTVIGSDATDGSRRRGVDRERVIGIDHGALRIQPLLKTGWARCGIAYGPFERRNGRTFGVFMLNGHNTSQAEHLAEGLRLRLWRWALGTETMKPVSRMIGLVRGRQRRFLARRFWQWALTGTRFRHIHPLDENLALGWFPAEVPTDPLSQGDGFVMHALGPECGELRARVGSGLLRAVRGVQNVPIHYFVMLRERGAAYYAASIPGVPGFGAHGHMRPLAIDPFASEPTVYAGIHQSVLGQIGFRVDTRVYGAQVVDVTSLGQWYGSAQAADSLCGDGPLQATAADTGERWTILQGRFRRTRDGLVAEAPENAAVLFPAQPSGLLHLLVRMGDSREVSIGLMWRIQDEDNLWCLELDGNRCRLGVLQQGTWNWLPSTREHRLASNAVNSIQVSDDGENLRLYLNGDLLFGTTFSDDRLQDAIGIGIRLIGDVASISLDAFEAHARRIPIPEEFDLGECSLALGTRTILSDDFAESRDDLAGRLTPIGGQPWRRLIGRGCIRLDGTGTASVQATVDQPCPGRTAYAIDWPNLKFSDVSVTITPPGSQGGKRERSRAGLIFWQDADNYIIVSVWADHSYGMSISAFFQVDGVEEIYDAVWTNVGKRIQWGVPFELRVVFEGQRFLAYVNGEPVLYRALRDVYPDWDKHDICRVGIVSNWEWGNDTGSEFRSFVVRDHG